MVAGVVSSLGTREEEGVRSGSRRAYDQVLSVTDRLSGTTQTADGLGVEGARTSGEREREL